MVSWPAIAAMPFAQSRRIARVCGERGGDGDDDDEGGAGDPVLVDSDVVENDVSMGDGL